MRRACIACDNVYSGPLSCPACGEPGEPLPQGTVPALEAPHALALALVAVEVPREAHDGEVEVIEEALTSGALDGVVSEVPRGVRWFVASGGFAGLAGGTLCRCWVLPAHRGNGAGAALYRVRLEAARAAGITSLTVTVRGEQQLRVYEARGFRVTARLASAPNGVIRVLMGRLL